MEKIYNLSIFDPTTVEEIIPHLLFTRQFLFSLYDKRTASRKSIKINNTVITLTLCSNLFLFGRVKNRCDVRISFDGQEKNHNVLQELFSHVINCLCSGFIFHCLLPGCTINCLCSRCVINCLRPGCVINCLCSICVINCLCPVNFLCPKFVINCLCPGCIYYQLFVSWMYLLSTVCVMEVVSTVNVLDVLLTVCFLM